MGPRLIGADSVRVPFIVERARTTRAHSSRRLGYGDCRTAHGEAATRKRTFMYIGVGTLVVILIIIVIVLLLRRG
jgi:Tfp pilus assembly protein PilN